MEINLTLTEAQARYIRGAILTRNLKVLGNYEICYQRGDIRGAKEWMDAHDDGMEVVRMIDAQLFS